MTTGMVTTWGGTVTDIGPIYPFVGSEFLLTILLLVFWVGWHILQIRGEGREHERDRADIVANRDLAQRMIDRDGG
ncbi:MAG: hypothetical protein ACT4NU_01650 [Chromatiales bacterium]